MQSLTLEVTHTIGPAVFAALRGAALSALQQDSAADLHVFVSAGKGHQ